MIKYLGSKRALLPLLREAVDLVEATHGPISTAVDLFSGTSRVGQMLKRRGLAVQANDHNAYAHTLARCYVEADSDIAADVARLIDELNRLPGRAGWFTALYAEEARFFQPKNAARIEAIREEIARKSLDPVREAVLLTSLLEAADRVDSTVGVQMAYLKSWSPRSFHDLFLRVPELIPRAAAGPSRAVRLDARDAAEQLSGDIIYIDPPYNHHSYLGNYHIWETLVAWDRPEVYGKARKRIDVRTRKSVFNSAQRFTSAFTEVVDRCRAKALIISFSNEGCIDFDELTALLSRRGRVRVLQREHRRYVGAKIGIFNPRGEKVGKAGPTENVEFVFVVDVQR